METSGPTTIRPYTDEAISQHAGRVGGARNLREISIQTDGGEYEFCYLVKTPGRAVLEAIAAEEAKKEKANLGTIQKLMIGCVLEGDRDAYEHDGGLYAQLLRQIGELVTQTNGSIKKL